MTSLRALTSLLPSLSVCLLPCANPVEGTARSQRPLGFEGRWVLDSPADAPSSVPRELEVEETWDGPNLVLHVTRRSPEEVRATTYKVGLIGGSVAGIPPGVPETQPSESTVVSARWDDGTVVIDEGWYAGPPGAGAPFRERRETWRLHPDGTLVVDAVERRSGVKKAAMTARYRRGR